MEEKDEKVAPCCPRVGESEDVDFYDYYFYIFLICFDHLFQIQKRDYLHGTRNQLAFTDYLLQKQMLKDYK